ncbi:MAG: TlpA disulfide reductase family protein, partial [Candidatus Omnitrophota bacterium]
QPVLLFFWTTWCPFCQVEIRKISERAGELAKAGIEVLTINTGESKSRVERFMQSRKINLKTLIDEDTAVSNSYNILGVPTFYIVDKQGKIIFEGNKFPENFKEIITKK